MTYRKLPWLGGLLLLGFLAMFAFPHDGLAQEPETPTPTQLTPLGRPTLLSTGLPPLNRPSATVSSTATASATATPSPSATRTRTPAPSDTPSRTATTRPTETPSPSATDTHTPEPTDTLSRTATERPSATSQPSATRSVTPEASDTPSSTPTETPTATLTDTVTSTLTSTSSATATLTPTSTSTATLTPTAISVVSGLPPASPDGEEDGGVSPLLLAGLALLGLLGGYTVLYGLNTAAVDRYATGFVVQTCPVCGEGHLEIEERPYRSLGIRRVRRTVRCDTCRSVLREVGRRRWRYAVDPNANPQLFQDLNGSIMSENDLLALAAKTEEMNARPVYMDDESDSS